MKEYPKEFENVFETTRSATKCDPNNIEFVDWPEEYGPYNKFFGDFIRRSYKELWLLCARVVWLYGRFKYNGFTMKKLHGNQISYDRAMSFFLRQYVGMTVQPFTRSYFLPKVHGYFKDFYPDFTVNNPFKNPELYAYPYKHVTLDFMVAVYQLPERLELLKVAEDKLFNYNQFMDYVVNYTECVNKGAGKDVYKLVMGRTVPPYFKYFKDNVKP